MKTLLVRMGVFHVVAALLLPLAGCAVGDRYDFGLQRGGFGNPFDVRAGSGRPLAAEMRGALIA